MKTQFTFLFLLFTVAVSAQFGEGGTKDIKKLKNTETLVVLGYHESYNEAIKQAFTKHWTFTKYRFISGAQYRKYCKNKKYSFVIIQTIRDYQFNEEKYDDVGIVLGGNCRYGPQDMVAYANMIVSDSSYYYVECVRAVQLMQNYLEMGLKKRLPADNYGETLSAYNKNHPKMTNYTMLIDKQDVLDRYKKDIKKYYTLPLKITTQREADQAMMEGRKDVMYTMLFFDIHGYPYRCALRASDSKILYGIEGQNREGFLMGKHMLKGFSNTKNTGKLKVLGWGL